MAVVEDVVGVPLGLDSKEVPVVRAEVPVDVETLTDMKSGFTHELLLRHLSWKGRSLATLWQDGVL